VIVSDCAPVYVPAVRENDGVATVPSAVPDTAAVPLLLLVYAPQELRCWYRRRLV
jgi:hypothetical protein